MKKIYNWLFNLNSYKTRYFNNKIQTWIEKYQNEFSLCFKNIKIQASLSTIALYMHYA